jgi:adenylate cyclase
VSARTLFRRRVPQVAGLYLAAAWGLLEFTDWATTRFGLSAQLPDAVVLLLALGLPATLWLAWRRGDVFAQGPVGAPIAPPPRRSVAVLPFANLSADPDNEYLSDGLTDEIIVALSKIGKLHVASRTSSFAFKGRLEDVRTIGHELNVESVLEGSVQRSGGRLRVSTQLVDVAGGYHLWSQTFDKPMEDVFAIEDDIANNVAGALRVILQEQERHALQQPQPADIRAYEYYLRGRQFLHQERKKSLEYACEMFDRALEIDRSYARAWAGVATACAFLNMYYPTAARDLERADQASRRALDLAPELAEAHSARGMVLFLMKRLEEAERELTAAGRIDPSLFEAKYIHARACFQGGRFDDAARLFEQANELRPDYQAAFFNAQSLEALGRKKAASAAYARALRIAERHMEFNPDDPRAATMRAVSLCRLGRKGEGQHWAERALSIDPEDAGVRYNVACLFALEGETDRAFQCLTDALHAGFANRDWIEHDPDLAAIRDDPRYVTLMCEKNGRPAALPDDDTG